MKIALLNGSPRPQGNTAKMASAFRTAAEEAGHQVVQFDVCRMNIKGCLACEYCHGRGNGKCIQKDDMHKIYADLRDTDMLVLASGDKDQYTGARFSFDGDFLGYLGLEDKGFFTSAGEVKDETLDEIRKMAKSL